MEATRDGEGDASGTEEHHLRTAYVYQERPMIKLQSTTQLVAAEEGGSDDNEDDQQRA